MRTSFDSGDFSSAVYNLVIRKSNLVIRLVIWEFSESEQGGISDCERIFLRPCFEKAGKDSEGVSTHETPSFIGPLTQPELVERLKGGRVGAKDDSQVVGMIGCGVESQVWKWWKGS